MLFSTSRNTNEDVFPSHYDPSIPSSTHISYLHKAISSNVAYIHVTFNPSPSLRISRLECMRCSLEINCLNPFYTALDSSFISSCRERRKSSSITEKGPLKCNTTQVFHTLWTRYRHHDFFNGHGSSLPLFLSSQFNPARPCPSEQTCIECFLSSPRHL